jgi:uncharacterized protein involved in outer membrane biogenesis
MARALKYLGIALGSIIGLIVLLVVALLLFIDPNHYKPQLITLVKEKTDMDLVLNDRLAWTFWPNVGVKLGKLSLTDPYLHEQLVGVDSAAVSVQLKPLFSKQIAVNAVLLDGAAVRYIQFADGSTSWDHLLNKLKSPKPAQPESSSTPVKLSVSKLAISNTSLTLVDQKTSTTRTVSGIDVQASDIALDKDFPLAVKFDYSQATPGNTLSTSNAIKTTLRVSPAFDHIMLHDLSADSSLSGAGGNLAMPESVALKAAAVDADLAQKLYQVDKLAVSADYKPMIGKPFTITLDSTISANLKDGLFTVAPLSLSLLDLQAKGALKASVPALAATAKPGTAVTEGMGITGNIATNTFNPRQLMSAFNITVPDTADPAALSHLNVRTDIAGSAQSMLLKNIRLGLDSSTLTGEAGISDLKTNRLYAKLNLDKINLDGYLPPANPNAKPAPAAAPADGGLLPVDLIRKQNLSVSLGIGALTVMTYPVTQFRIAATAGGGMVNVSELKGSIYGGSFSFPASVNVQGAQPVLSVKPVVSQIAVGPIAEKILQKHLFEGTVNFNGALGMSGNSVDAWKRSLSGNTNLELKDGVMHGVNMMQLVVGEMGKYQSLLALAGKNTTTAASAQSDTPIGELTSVASISNGLVNQTTLKADLQKAQMSGTGNFNLVSLDADYHLIINLDRSVSEQLSHYNIPVRCKGNVTAAAKMCGVDSAAVRDIALKAGVSNQLEKLGVPAGDVKSAVEAKKQEVKEQAKQKAIDQLNNKLPAGLKGLFGK